MFGSSNRLKCTFSTSGPTDDACLLVLVVIFGLEMLGLVNFDNKNCCNMVPNCSWCQIVCGAKLSILHFGAKLSVVPNCPQCQIVRCQIFRGAKLSAVQNCPGAKLSYNQ